MSEETQNVSSAIRTGNVSDLGNTVERLGLLTSRLYSEYLSGQNAFAENPSLLNEALNILTKSQEATIEAQRVMNQQRSQTPFSGANTEEADTEKEPMLAMIERRASLFSAVATPAWVFYVSQDFGPIKQNITRGLGLISGLICLRYYLKQHGGQNDRTTE
jgi:hypothetical protein